MLSKKIVLLGFYGVGKSSLVSQYVYKKFSDKYLTTIGVSIEKKVVEINGQSLSMLIWDVAGESTIGKVFQPYLVGAHGGLYVFDLTRQETFDDIVEELGLVRKVVGNDIPIKVIGNKADLILQDELENILSQMPIPVDYVTSAKTSQNVEEAFHSLGEEVISHGV